MHTPFASDGAPASPSVLTQTTRSSYGVAGTSAPRRKRVAAPRYATAHPAPGGLVAVVVTGKVEVVEEAVIIITNRT